MCPGGLSTHVYPTHMCTYRIYIHMYTYKTMYVNVLVKYLTRL